MTIVRVGTNKKYSDGWEAAFGRKSRSKTKSAAGKKGTTAKAKSKKQSKK